MHKPRVNPMVVYNNKHCVRSLMYYVQIYCRYQKSNNKFHVAILYNIIFYEREPTLVRQ